MEKKLFKKKKCGEKKMVDFKKGIYEKEFKYEDNDGVEQGILLKPLPVKHLPALFNVVKRFQGRDTEKPEEFLAALDDDVIEKLVNMCVAVMKKSFPTMDESDIDGFVASNFLTLFPVIIEMNLKSGQVK